VSTVLGAGVAPHLAGLRRAGAATAIVFALFALPAFFALDTTAAARLALLGATQFALGVALGAALGRAAAPLAAAVVAATTALPFLLARPDAPAAALRTAELLFTASPVAAAAPLVRVDFLRHPLLYENSTLGSSIPIGYPPADVLSAAAVALGGILYWVASRRTRSVKGESPAATF
jgi:hypothetical protein